MGARRARIRIALLGGWLGGALLLAGCVAAPRSYESEAVVAVEGLDYAGWDALLREHVSDGRVDYPGLTRDPRFDAFLRELRDARVGRATPRSQRLAFLVNAYNALAIEGVLQGGSPASLVGRGRFFLRTRHPVGGEEITLWDLEHERIRVFGDPRIHFAIVCASASCPRLASHAYLPEALDEQLDQAARVFVNDPERNRFDRRARVAWLSEIFDWYADEFALAAGSVEQYVARYVHDGAVAADLQAGRYVVRHSDYDWSLNGVPPAARQPCRVSP